MSNGPLLIGKARDMILEYLKVNINPELQLDDNKRQDGINLEPISSQAFYISEAFISVQPPACYVLKAGPMKINYSGDPNWLQADDPFQVIISCEDMGADKLEQKCESYGRVLYKLLDQQDLLSSDGKLKLHLVNNSLEFTDLMSRKLGQSGTMFRRDAVLSLTAKHFEARTTT